MIRKLKTIFFLQFIILQASFGASFVAVSQAQIKRNINTFTDNFDNNEEEFEAQGPAVRIGTFITNSIAIELGYMSLKFEPIEKEIIDDLNYKLVQSGQQSFLTYGIRWYIWEFLNFTLGGSATLLEQSVTLTPRNDEVEIESDRTPSTYYGIGLGLTFNKIQVFFDRTRFNQINSNGVDVTELGLRVFF